MFGAGSIRPHWLTTLKDAFLTLGILFGSIWYIIWALFSYYRVTIFKHFLYIHVNICVSIFYCFCRTRFLCFYLTFSKMFSVRDPPPIPSSTISSHSLSNLIFPVLVFHITSLKHYILLKLS